MHGVVCEHNYGFTFCCDFANMAQLKYFGTAVTNQNLIQEEIKRRLN
jgi:hypothetical protein